MKNRKEHFLKAVRLLAPNDNLILQAARRVNEEGLPTAPGGVALEFVVAFQRMKAPAWPCKARFKSSRRASDQTGHAPATQEKIGLQVAIRIKSADFWIKLGQPDQALLEIKSLPERLQKHPSVLKAHLAAVRAVRELSENSANR